ncbi:pentapeptide repeat-containing protein [Candidatus Riflebacteria bacterium]
MVNNGGAILSFEPYDILMRCSEKKNLSEWNNWHGEQHSSCIGFCGVSFKDAYLEKANFDGVSFEKVDFDSSNLRHTSFVGSKISEVTFKNCDLKEVKFEESFISKAYFSESELDNSSFSRASFHSKITFLKCNLVNSRFITAQTPETSFNESNMEKSVSWWGNFSNSNFKNVCLKDSKFSQAVLEGTEFEDSNLKGAEFERCTTDAKTVIKNCQIDKLTDFAFTNLADVNIDHGQKQLLEYNTRRKLWEKWYEKHLFLGPPIRRFWFISDYGRDAIRIFKELCYWVLSFAALYYFAGILQKGGIIEDLFYSASKSTGGEIVYYPALIVPIRAIYLSFLTMVTLGFGPASPIPHSVAGHLFIITQVILGFILFAALVSRLVFLFKSRGPAGAFDEEEVVGFKHWWQANVGIFYTYFPFLQRIFPSWPETLRDIKENLWLHILWIMVFIVFFAYFSVQYYS